MKQMMWHKNGKRYNPDKMVHPSDGEAWTSFNDKHRLKSDEARPYANGRPLHSSGSTHSRLVQFNSSYIDLYIT